MRKFFLSVAVLVIVIAAVGCTSTPNEPTITTQCDTTNLVYQDWTMPAGTYYSHHFNLRTGDTLLISLVLREGDYAAQVLLSDSTEFEHWVNNETSFPIWRITHFVGTGNYIVRIPEDGRYYFAIYNDAILATVKVSVLINKVTWSSYY